MTKEELEKEAEEKYNERLKQNGYKVEYRNETYIDGYLDSAEPREKRIAELTEQNTSLLTSVENLNKSVQELEKENAELKSIADFQTSSNMDRYFQLKRSKDQLTKSKELLRQLVNIEYAVNIPKDKIISLRVKAEQFLSEVEK